MKAILWLQIGSRCARKSHVVFHELGSILIESFDNLKHTAAVPPGIVARQPIGVTPRGDSVVILFTERLGKRQRRAELNDPVGGIDRQARQVVRQQQLGRRINDGLNDRADNSVGVFDVVLGCRHRARC